MIRNLARRMLVAQTLSSLTVSLCLLIDNIMIGRFLGVTAIAAYGLANPVLLVIGAIASMLSAGVQVACSRSIGMGSQEETNSGYSSAIAAAAAVSVVFVAVVLVFRNPLATAMGAGTQGALYEDTRAYLAGFIIGAPASMGALILVPFLQMAGKSGLLIAAVLGMTVGDVALDLLNVLVFDGGMFGMGLASSLSYYIAVVIAAFYFLSKKCEFKFARRLVTRAKIRELLAGGVPTVFNMASTVVLVFAMNRIMLGAGGADAVAAYSVVSTIGNASNCVSTGMGGVSLTLSGIFFNEEDRTSLRELMKVLVKDALFMGAGVCAVLLLAAPLMVKLFIPEAGTAQQLAVLGVRLFAVGIIPCVVTNAYKSAYQGTERVIATEVISVLEGAALPVLCALAFGALLGPRGAWTYFVAGEILTLLGLYLFALKKRGAVREAADPLLLPDSFGVAPEDGLECAVSTVEQVVDASQRAEQFCLDSGADARLARRIGLCVEEMAANTVTHGFVKTPGEHHLWVRLLRKADTWILRFRDDCRAFDPMHYVPTSDEKGIGIRLVTGLADEVRYTYSLSLNNLTIHLKDHNMEEKA